MRRLAVVVLALVAVMAVLPTAGVAAPGHGKGGFTLTVSGGLGLPTGKLAADLDPYQRAGKATYDAHDVYLPGTFVAPDLAAGTGVSQQLGAGFGASADYFLSDELAVGVDFSMVTFRGKDVVLPADLPGELVLNGSGEVVSCQPLGRPVSLPEALKAGGFLVGAHGRYLVSTGTPLRPFARLGLGLYGRRIEAEGAAAEWLGWSKQSDTRFGVNGGLGVDWKAADRLSLILGATYHQAFGRFEKDLPSPLHVTDVRTTLAGDWSYLALEAGITVPLPGLR